MQGKFLNLSLSPKQRWAQLTKVGVTLAMFWFVGSRILSEGESLHWDFSPQETLLLLMALALIPFNLGLEAQKWRLLQVRIQKDFSFAKAMKGVLIGVCLGLFTPNRLGDYMGRLMVVPKKHRWESGSFILVNRLSQMFITLVLGIVAFQLALGLGIVQLSSKWIGFIQVISGLFFLSLLLLFPFKNALFSLVRRIFPRWRPINRVSDALSSIQLAELLKVSALALLRYAVFSTQYLLILYAFGANGSLEEMSLLVVLVFLIKSLAPIASLAELGIREAVAVMVGAWLGVSGILATTTAFSLYLINLVLPAAIGLLLIYKEKYE